MASTISAGTTSGTAINISGDTSGALQLQTNNGTTALTLATDQTATFAGNALLANNNYVGFKNTSGSPTCSVFQDTSNDFWLYNGGATNTRFYTNATERMRIDSSGNVGIGTTSASEKLRVNAGNSTRAIKIVGDSAWIEFDNANTKITGGGNLIGNAAGQVQFIATSNGVYLANGGTSWSALSDENTKDIIEPITDATSKIKSLRAVIGKYKDDENNTRKSFLIAQDVEKVLPEAISKYTKNNVEYLGLAYTDVIPLLVAAIQELNAKVEAQATTIAELQAKVG